MGTERVDAGELLVQIPVISSTSNPEIQFPNEPTLNSYLHGRLGFRRRRNLSYSSHFNLNIMYSSCRKPLSSPLKYTPSPNAKLKVRLMRFFRVAQKKNCIQEMCTFGPPQIKTVSTTALCFEENSTPLYETEGIKTQSAVVIIASIFLVSIFALTYIYFEFPELEPEEKKHIKLPWDIEEAKELGRVLEKHKDRNYYDVLAAIVVVYIFLQTFAIPGSISLSVLSGFLFPFPVALALVCFCSATGASFCYLLSLLAGRRLVYKYFPDRAAQYSLTVQKHRQHIFNYILFLRITPFLPNWFINIAAPIVNVPLLPFWLGTFLGVAPPSFVAIQAGQTLQELSSMSGTWSWTSVSWLAAFSILSMLPVFLRDRLRTKFD